MSPLRLVSLLLQYPDRELLDARAELTAEADALPAGPVREALLRFLAWWAVEPPLAVQQEYVATFDLSRRTSLELSWYTQGDRRQRGMTLVALKRRYEAAGLPLVADELPDHLAVVAEFAAFAPAEAGDALLADLRAPIELLRAALHRAESPWRHVLDALCLTMPALGDEDLETLRRLAADGPPTERVGLEPFAPPEVMPEPACGGIR